MAITPVGTASSASALQASSISQQDFFRLLVTQLSFQDPLKPIDNEAFIAQIAQFTSLEQTRQLNDRIGSLLTVQSTTQAIGLIGRTVEVASATGTVVGQVSTLSFQSGTPLLTITTSTGQYLTGIGLDQIAVVRS
ncbi:MAG: flagellar hook capping FlgD N-terminal domain-containing protein [Burkholderiaceae bacterium]